MEPKKSDRQRIARYESIFSSIPHLIVVKDRQGKFVFANDALAAFYGEDDPRSMLGKSDSDYNDNREQTESFRQHDEEVLETGLVKIIPKEVNTNSKGNSHWLTTIKVPHTNDDGEKEVIVVATYIDDLINLEHQIAQQKRIEFLSKTLGHKLSNKVYALSQLIDKLEAPEKDKTEIEGAMENIKRFSEDFIKLSKADQLDPLNTDLFDLVRRVVTPFGGKATITINDRDVSTPQIRKHSLKFPVYGDVEKLEDVFAELVQNSIHWKREDNLSRHRINITIRKSLPPSLSNILTQPYIITVSDNGRGFESDVGDIFAPFVSSRTGGTGLGLSIVSEILRAHRGSIEKSSGGYGARFLIKIPVDYRKIPISKTFTQKV